MSSAGNIQAAWRSYHAGDRRAGSPGVEPPEQLSTLRKPLIVGLWLTPERLMQIRRNRLLSLNQMPDTAYVEEEAVTREIAFARRMFADNGWPVIDVTRRSIEETAAAVMSLLAERRRQPVA